MLVLTTVVVLAGVLLSLYINRPPPALSTEVLAWRDAGFVFKYSADIDIFYRDVKGEGNSTETLVCIHGFPTASFDWLRIWDQLLLRFGRIIAYDMLGHGFSSKPLIYHVVNPDTSSIEKVNHNYTVGEQTDILIELLTSQKIESFHILSHDLGDTVVQELLARYNNNFTHNIPLPFIIKSVCLTNGGVFPDTHHPTIGQQILTNEYFGEIAVWLMPKFAYDLGLKQVFSPSHQPSNQDLDDWWAMTRYNDGNRVMGRVLYYITERRYNQERWTGALRDAGMPVHMTYGPADPVNPPPFADVFRTRLPNATITVLGSDVGHYVAWEVPGDVIADYWKFLDNQVFKD